MNRTWAVARLCAVVGTASLLAGCGSFLSGLVGVQIKVNPTHKALRDQVLGSYDEVGHEVFMLAGVRSVDPVSGETSPPPRMTESERVALDARRSMEFNRDDVRRFLRAGYVGEGSDGKLCLFPEEEQRLAQEDPWLCALVRDVTAEENQDRERVMRRILDTTPGLEGDEGRRAVAEIMAEKYRQDAEPGVRVQRADGTWETKAEGMPRE